MGVLERWQVTSDELDEMISRSPSLRGLIFGYVSEHKLRKLWFSDKRVSNLHKSDNHDRARKGDLTFNYKGVEITVEVKSLQNALHTRSRRHVQGKFQCDASDRRQVELPDGHRIETTCLVVGEFDLLAVNLFEFRQEWQFAFARNKDLPAPASASTPRSSGEQLLATLIDVTWPLKPPFEPEPFRLLDEIAAENQKRP